MASKNTIVKMIMAMKTVFPYYAKESENAVLVETWEMLLSKYPDELVQMAFMKSLETCTQPPTPAHIISIIKDAEKSNDLTDEELWDVLCDTLRKVRRQVYMFQFTAIEANGKTQGQNARLRIEEIWNKLHPKLKQFTATESGLIRLSELNDDDLKYEKNRFLKTIPVIEKRMEMAHELEMNPQVMRIVRSSFKMIGSGEE